MCVRVRGFSACIICVLLLLSKRESLIRESMLAIFSDLQRSTMSSSMPPDVTQEPSFLFGYLSLYSFNNNHFFLFFLNYF